MSAQIGVTISDHSLERAQALAKRTGRPVADILADTIEVSLDPLGDPVGDPANGEKAFFELSDEEVLSAANLALSSADDDRLSDLLDCQQADRLTTAERSELAALMQLYQSGLLRKAQALREAVRRGLRTSLDP